MTDIQRATLAVSAGTAVSVGCLLWLLDGPGAVSMMMLSSGCVVVGLVVAVAAVVGRSASGVPDTVYGLSRYLRVIQVLAIVMFASSFYGMVLPRTTGFAVAFGVVSVVVAGSITWNAVAESSWVPYVILLTCVTVALVIGLSASMERNDTIDVMLFQSEAANALVAGSSPYEITYDNHYTPEKTQRFYDPSLVVDGVLQFGYLYPPLSLIVVTPFEVLFDEVRVAYALALIATGVVVAAISPTHHGRMMSAAFLCVSPGLYVVRFGWTEPILMLAASLAVLAASRRSRAAPYLVGLAVSLKQYAVLLFPASLLLIERPWSVRRVTREMWPAFAVLIVTTLPFLIWSPTGFLHSVVRVHFLQPFRIDSLALPAAVARVIGSPPPELLVLAGQAAVVIGVVFVVLRRSPIGPHGFAVSSAAILLALIVFSKQAFPNYYIVPIALLFSGAAACLPATCISTDAGRPCFGGGPDRLATLISCVTGSERGGEVLRSRRRDLRPVGGNRRRVPA